MNKLYSIWIYARYYCKKNKDRTHCSGTSKGSSQNLKQNFAFCRLDQNFFSVDKLQNAHRLVKLDSIAAWVCWMQIDAVHFNFFSKGSIEGWFVLKNAPFFHAAIRVGKQWEEHVVFFRFFFDRTWPLVLLLLVLNILELISAKFIIVPELPKCKFC